MIKIFGLLFLLTSCSGLSLGVRWADTFAISQLDDYFTLSGEKSEEAKKEFKEIWISVRKQDFPALADKLDQMALMTEENQLTSTKLTQWIDETQEVIRIGLRRFEPFGQNLVEEEAAHGFKRFDREVEKQQEKRSKKFSDSEHIKEETAKRFARLLENTFEELSAEQEKFWQQESKENPLPLLAQEESRKVLWERFKQSRLDPKERKEFVRTWFRNWDSLQTDTYNAARMAQQKRFRVFLWRLWETSNAEQKRKLIENFRGRAKELRGLSIR
jgi:hypothetical protein